MRLSMYYIILLLLLFNSNNPWAQATSESDLFKSIVNDVYKQNLQTESIGNLLCIVGHRFIDYPYESGTLDVDKTEHCIVTFSGFDCVTFFEVSLGISRIIKKGKTAFADLLSEVQYTRYRRAILSDYTSRLHYSSEWIHDNIEKGVVRDKTKELGGIPIKFKLNYMSNHPDSYIGLKNCPEQIEKIKEIEKKISTWTFHYIPTEQISKIENKLNSGDIIFFVLDLNGLDFSHVGICCRVGEKPRLLHASSKAKKVILDRTISEYCKEHKKIKGITIVEPLEPTKNIENK